MGWDENGTLRASSGVRAGKGDNRAEVASLSRRLRRRNRAVTVGSRPAQAHAAAPSTRLPKYFRNPPFPCPIQLPLSQGQRIPRPGTAPGRTLSGPTRPCPPRAKLGRDPALPLPQEEPGPGEGPAGPAPPPPGKPVPRDIPHPAPPGERPLRDRTLAASPEEDGNGKHFPEPGGAGKLPARISRTPAPV